MSEDRVELLIERAVSEALEDHEAKMVRHMDQNFHRLETMFASAFPGGDPAGHRMAHETQIKQAVGWEKLKSEVVSKFLTGGLWMAAGWGLLALWNSFLANVRTP